MRGDWATWSLTFWQVGWDLFTWPLTWQSFQRTDENAQSFLRPGLWHIVTFAAFC